VKIHFVWLFYIRLVWFSGCVSLVSVPFVWVNLVLGLVGVWLVCGYVAFAKVRFFGLGWFELGRYSLYWIS
jgi:hypothetical protein